jgi:flavin reductase (DIM6/NTAB) family NADH-FMN oxidoreductase RutF
MERENAVISVDVGKLAPPDAYKLLIGSVVPRPIAWVSTVDKNGLSNLAPFSFFNGICSNPPSVLFCPVNHPDGREKDTLVNVRDTRQFVVNIVNESLVQIMNETSANYPSGVSEFETLGIATLPSLKVLPPRVKDSPIQMECELLQVLQVGDGSAGSGHVVIGKILQMHFAPGVYQDGKINLEHLRPVARLGGPFYARIRDTFQLDRPKGPPSSGG